VRRGGGKEGGCAVPRPVPIPGGRAGGLEAPLALLLQEKVPNYMGEIIKKEQ